MMIAHQNNNNNYFCPIRKNALVFLFNFVVYRPTQKENNKKNKKKNNNNEQPNNDREKSQNENKHMFIHSRSGFLSLSL